MKVKDLQRQIQYCLDNGHINKDDEIIMLGSGDRSSGYFSLGLIIPRIEKIDIKEHSSGFYGIGVLKR